MDHRIALKPNTRLCLSNSRGESNNYIIENEIGRGASCIVYEVSQKTETGDKTLYRVKECYPYKLNISRQEDGTLVPADKDADAFKDKQEQLRTDFKRANELYYSGENYAMMANQLNLFEQNGTTYILVAYTSRKTLATYEPVSVKECITLVKKVAYAIGRIHKQGFLYLDVKPDNVLVVDGDEKQILLFDFDSLISMQDLRAVENRNYCDLRLSYTRGFSPLELLTSRVNHLGPHTDVYGVGALLYYLLFGHTPDASACDKDAEYNFSGDLQYTCDKLDDKLFAALQNFFHDTLAAYYKDRYATMEEVRLQLKEIEKFADPVIPRIYSTKISKTKIFYGRENEFHELDEFMADPDCNCLFITGMGGIGKSTFIREYLFRRRKQFDTVLYVHYKGSIEATITNDYSIEINTLSHPQNAQPKISEIKVLNQSSRNHISETTNELEGAEIEARYFNRKVNKIRELVRGTSAVLVIDDFDGEKDAGLRMLLGTDLKVILLSRNEFSHQNYAVMKLSAVSDNALRNIFEKNLGRPIANDEQDAFNQILLQVERHTLVLELIAKQIASSHLTILEAADLTREHGFSSIAPEKVKYAKDEIVFSDTIGNIIDAFFTANELSEAKKKLMKVASLLGANGIDITLFQHILKLDTKDDLNELIQAGWLMISGDMISMHQVVQEAVRRWEWSDMFLVAAEQFLTYFCVEIRIESTKNNYPKKLYDDILKMHEMEDVMNKKLQGIGQQQRVKDWACQKEKKRLEVIKGQPQKYGLTGKVYLERYNRRTNDSPADMKKLGVLLIQAESILKQCKRDSEIKTKSVYSELLYNTVLNISRYSEEHSELFSDFIVNGATDLLKEVENKNPITLMRLFTMLVYYHANNDNLDEAWKLIEQAQQLLKKVHGNKRVYALYYNLLGSYYDSCLDGAYDPAYSKDEHLLRQLLEAVEKSRSYSKSKKTLMVDDDHLYAKNTVAKAMILLRSGRGTDKEICALLENAKSIIAEYTLPYADVRLHYYLACAWYFTLVHDNVSIVDEFITQAKALSDKITPTDAEKIDNIYIPCANMYFEMKCHEKSLEYLEEGTRICAKHPDTPLYAKKKQELCNHYWEVGIEAKLFKKCKMMMNRIESENEKIADIENRVAISDDVRRILTQQ